MQHKYECTYIHFFLLLSQSLYVCLSNEDDERTTHRMCIECVQKKREKTTKFVRQQKRATQQNIEKCMYKWYICDIVVVVSACVCVTTSALHGCFTLNYSDCTCIHRFFTTLLNPQNSNKTGTTLNIEHRNWTEESSKKDSQHRLCAYAVRFFKHSNQNDRQKIGMRCCTKDFFSTSNWVSVTREAFNAKAYCATKHTHKYTHQWLHAIIETERTLPFFARYYDEHAQTYFHIFLNKNKYWNRIREKRELRAKQKHTRICSHTAHTLDPS